MVGVTYEQAGEMRTAEAGSEGVLSAGAFDSPQLLVLSGTGPADHLRDHDITARVDSPGIGVNLQDHLKLGIVCEQSSGRLAPAPTSTVVETGCFVRTDDDLPTPDLRFHDAPVYRLEHGLGAPDDDRTRVTTIPTRIRPESTGTVRLASDDPHEAPVIDPEYLTADGDIDPLVEGVKLAREIADTDTMAPCCGPHGVRRDRRGGYPRVRAVTRDNGVPPGWDLQDGR